MNNFDNSLGNENILGGDILATNLGEENTSLGITPNDGTFRDPFSNYLESLSLIEKAIQSERENNSNDNNPSTNDFSPIDTGIDPFLKCKKRTPVKADRLNGEMNFCQPHKTAQRPYWLGDFWFST